MVQEVKRVERGNSILAIQLTLIPTNMMNIHGKVYANDGHLR